MEKDGAVTITVLPGERQGFDGFGSSVANFNGFYEKLPKEKRDELSEVVRGSETDDFEGL